MVSGPSLRHAFSNRALFAAYATYVQLPYTPPHPIHVARARAFKTTFNVFAVWSGCVSRLWTSILVPDGPQCISLESLGWPNLTRLPAR